MSEERRPVDECFRLRTVAQTNAADVSTRRVDAESARMITVGSPILLSAQISRSNLRGRSPP